MAIQLTGGLLGPSPAEEELDPMASLANLADVMLVFACGLMIAVVVAWNVDTSAVTQISEETKLSEVDDIEEAQDQLESTTGNSYVDMGKVYMDPATGKYYMITQNDEAAASADAAGTTATDSGAAAGSGASAESGATAGSSATTNAAGTGQ